MVKIVVDETLRQKLGNLAEPIELVDTSGLPLAHVVPFVDLADYELTEPPIAEEELQRREQSGKWFTTAEVLAHLQRLENT